MRALVSTLCIGIGASLLVACSHPSQYTVNAVSSEAVDHKLDGQWFAREMTDDQSRLYAIELVYCPTLPNVATVCRTGMIWEDSKSILFEGYGSGSAAPQPASAPEPPAGAPPPPAAAPPAAAPTPPH
jgi:hypothetical protein